MVRSAYWSEFHQAGIQTGQAKELPDYEVIAILSAISIPVFWKEKRKKGRGAAEMTGWREYSGVVEYEPGQVLHREWRAASEWELDEWQRLSGDELMFRGIYRDGWRYTIQIVEKIKDLPAAIRQRGRHVPGRKIGRKRGRFVLNGDANILAGYAGRLSELLSRSITEPNDEVMGETSLELSKISLEFTQSRSQLKEKIRENIQHEIQLAQGGTFWSFQARAGQTIADLLAERERDYRIAIRSIELAAILRDLMKEIEGNIGNRYRRLGQLAEQLQELISGNQPIDQVYLMATANEAYEIWEYLQSNIPTFNPYYERLRAPEIERLSRVRDHAMENRASTVYNDLELAIGKLEAIALGERVTRAELVKGREVLSQTM